MTCIHKHQKCKMISPNSLILWFRLCERVKQKKNCKFSMSTSDTDLRVLIVQCVTMSNGWLLEWQKRTRKTIKRNLKQKIRPQTNQSEFEMRARFMQADTQSKRYTSSAQGTVKQSVRFVCSFQHN